MADKITLTFEIGDWRDHAPNDFDMRASALRRIMKAAQHAAEDIAESRNVSVTTDGRVQFSVDGKAYDVAAWEM